MSQDERAPDPATRTEGEGLTLDMPEGMGAYRSQGRSRASVIRSSRCSAAAAWVRSGTPSTSSCASRWR